MLIQQITPDQAKEILDENPDAVYLDVRSVPEFERGHPQGAYNIPVFHQTPQGMAPNADFLAVVEKHFPKNKTLLVGCQVGGRSQKACEMLASQGFERLHNIQGGFGGLRSPAGSIPGWQEQGFPVETGSEEGKGYQSLAGS